MQGAESEGEGSVLTHMTKPESRKCSRRWGIMQRSPSVTPHPPDALHAFPESIFILRGLLLRTILSRCGEIAIRWWQKWLVDSFSNVKMVNLQLFAPHLLGIFVGIL